MIVEFTSTGSLQMTLTFLIALTAFVLGGILGHARQRVSTLSRFEGTGAVPVFVVGITKNLPPRTIVTTGHIPEHPRGIGYLLALVASDCADEYSQEEDSRFHNAADEALEQIVHEFSRALSDDPESEYGIPSPTLEP